MERLGRAAYDSNNTSTSNGSSITTNTRTNTNTNNQGKSTLRIPANRVSTIVKDTKVKDKDVSHENGNISLDNDNNTEFSKYTMISLVASSDYSSCYSNVASSHSNYTLTSVHHDIPTNADLKKTSIISTY